MKDFEDKDFAWFSEAEDYWTGVLEDRLIYSKGVCPDLEFAKREAVLEDKKIHDDAYFVVGYSVDPTEEDIPGTGLYIAGYRPYTYYPKFDIKRRGYGRIVVAPDQELLNKHFTERQAYAINEVAKMTFPNEKRFEKAQLYLMEDAFEFYFKKEMENNDWYDVEKVKRLIKRIVKRRRMQYYQEPGMYIYTPGASSGYYIGGQKYAVWAAIVGVKDTTGEYKKRALCIDILSGSVCTVPFDWNDKGDFDNPEAKANFVIASKG